MATNDKYDIVRDEITQRDGSNSQVDDNYLRSTGETIDRNLITNDTNDEELPVIEPGDRGVFGGGYDGPFYLNTIDYITISTLGNAQDFGDLTVSRDSLAATSNGLL